MAAASTIYDIRLRYLMEDRASRGMAHMEREARQAARSTGLLRRSLSGINGLMAAAGAGLGLHAAGKALLGFNSNMEQARIQMAGMLKLNMGGTFAANMERASTLVGRLQERAAKSVGTTQDMVQMASMLARPISAAGASMADLELITARAVVAAKSMGVDAPQAARDIEQALMGNLTKMERFARAILEPQGFTTREFNAMTAGERLQALRSALNDPAIQKMAEAQATSFEGRFSTFVDALQRFMGSVGKPLFEAITAELGKWNAWIEKNQATVTRWAKDFGSALVDGFEMVRDVFTFIIDHRELLLGIAKAYAAFKIASFGGGLLSSGLGAAGGFLQRMGGVALANNFDRLGLRTAKIGAGFANAAGAIGKFIPAIGIATGALLAIDNHFDQKKREANIKRLGEGGRALTAVEEVAGARERIEHAKRVIAHFTNPALFRKNELTSKQELELERARAAIPEARKELRAGLEHMVHVLDRRGLLESDLTLSPSRAAAFGVLAGPAGGARAVMAGEDREVGARLARQAAREAVIEYRAAIRSGRLSVRDVLLGREMVEQARNGGNGAQPKGDHINVTVNRIEVQSDDPDRFMFQLVETFRDAAKNPSGARDALRGG